MRDLADEDLPTPIGCCVCSPTTLNFIICLPMLEPVLPCRTTKFHSMNTTAIKTQTEKMIHPIVDGPLLPVAQMSDTQTVSTFWKAGSTTPEMASSR